MPKPKQNKLEAVLIKLRDNISGEQFKKLQEERKLSGALKDLIDDTLTAIIIEENLSENSAEAFQVLISLSYIEGYAHHERAGKDESNSIKKRITRRKK